MWLDDISRDRLRTGNLQMLIDDYSRGRRDLQPDDLRARAGHGDAYDGQLADLKTRGVSVEEASRLITTYDIRWACDVLRPAYDATGGQDGRVSIEVDPRLASDTAKTIAEARGAVVDGGPAEPVHQDPRHPEGLPAITQAISEGISVNVTLIFSLAAVRRGHRRVHGRPGAGRGGRA